MPTPPRVFVGIPVYNGERFLKHAIESLLRQTYTNFTVLIADNASADGTRDICEHYCAQDTRVRYVRHDQNMGAPRNWNYLVEQAQGDYFKWAGANDECANRFLEACVETLDEDPGAVLCQGRTSLVDEETGNHEYYRHDLELRGVWPAARLKRLFLELRLNNGQSGLIRLSALKRTQLERPYIGGDIALMAELALLGRFVVLPEILFYRRMGHTTFSRYLNDTQLEDFYGKEVARAKVGPNMQLHLDLLRCAMRAPIPFGQRVSATLLVMRRMLWDRKLLLNARQANAT